MYRHHARAYDKLLVIQIRMRLKTLMNRIRDELTKLGILTDRLSDKDVSTHSGSRRRTRFGNPSKSFDRGTNCALI